MAAWDDVDLVDMVFREEEDAYMHPCPCGDDFVMSVDDLLNCEELAPCPSCSLLLRVVYDPEEFLRSIELAEEEEEAAAAAVSGAESTVVVEQELVDALDTKLQVDSAGPAEEGEGVRG